MKKKFFIGLAIFIAFIYFVCGDDDAEKTISQEETTWPPAIKDIKVDLGDVAKKNFYIIFDGSGSMAGNKITTAKLALKKFITLIPEGANIGLTAFDSNNNSERSPLGTDREEIVRAVDQINAGGTTPLGESVGIAYKKLGEQAAKQLGYGEYNLIIITDGEATDGSVLEDNVEFILKNTPIIIHTIGFQIGKGHSLNQPGRIYYKTANNFDELSAGLEKVLAELENFTVKEFEK